MGVINRGGVVEMDYIIREFQLSDIQGIYHLNIEKMGYVYPLQ